MKKVYSIALLCTLVCIATPTHAFQTTALKPYVEVLTPGVIRDFTITQYHNFPQDFSFFLVFLVGYGPVKITLSKDNSEDDLLVINGWGISSAGVVPIIKFGRSRVSLAVSVNIGSERYPTGIVWFSSWIAGPIEEETTYELKIAF